jgi:tRNA-dihydrouridine synthase B
MHPLPCQIAPGQPPTALAPMQDVTMRDFLHLVARCGAPDYFFTEYYRVHAQSKIDENVKRSICDNETGRPIFAQIIGEDIDCMRRAARELVKLPVAGIDLNLGCPAPKVFRKNVGGGLLRDPAKVDELLAALREETAGTIFSVKMRYGFENDSNFDRFLEMLNRHGVDLVSLHARTVIQLYRGKPDYSYIAKAVHELKCPVLANGDISSSDKAVQVLKETGAFGVMIGRPAVRNPWIFRQCREKFAGEAVFAPLLSNVRKYVDELWIVTGGDSLVDKFHIPRMKKLLNFIGLGVDAKGGFLSEMRLVKTGAELFAVCDKYMICNGNDSRPFAPDALPNLVARPNHED